MLIKLKPTKLKRAYFIIVLIGVPLSALMTLLLGDIINYYYIYIICALVVSFMVLFALYLNKNEIDFINIEDEQITIKYINKTFFKKKQYTCKIDSLKIDLENDMLILEDRNSRLITIIRKESFEIENEWEVIKDKLIKH